MVEARPARFTAIATTFACCSRISLGMALRMRSLASAKALAARDAVAQEASPDKGPVALVARSGPPLPWRPPTASCAALPASARS